MDGETPWTSWEARPGVVVKVRSDQLWVSEHRTACPNSESTWPLSDVAGVQYLG